MTLTIIFGISILIGIGLCLLDLLRNWYCDWNVYVGVTIIFFAVVAFIINLIFWIPSAKDSEIKYTQLLTEKAAIESMLETDKDVDRLLINSAVIDYNNRIIQARTNSARPIYRDYYNQNLDWAGLSLIEWK